MIPADSILFATETVGAVRGIDPETGRHFDNIKQVIDSIEWLSPGDRDKIFERNVRKVYPRFAGAAAAS